MDRLRLGKRRTRKHALSMVGLLALPIAAALAQSAAAPMKAGLWDAQVSSTTVMTLPPEMEARIAAMPPAQQAQMRATMSGAKPVVQTYKSCVAKQTSLDDVLNQQQQKAGTKCSYSNRVQTANSASFDTTCTTLQGSATGHTDVHWIDDDHMSATTHMTASSTSPRGAMQMSINSTMTWKYLGADCGDVKPNSTSAVTTQQAPQ
jgi:hypothetical protein